MKKLYKNIESINIRGGVSQLSELVTSMDISLQNIAESTEKLFGQLIRHRASNMDNQFKKVVNTTVTLRNVLSQASEELNDMQNQIVEYQNKIYRYEEMPERAQRPNKYLVTRDRNISVDTSGVLFSKSDMLRVAAMLRNYREVVFHHIKTISEKKNSIAHVWRDRQYNDFAEFIDAVIRNTVEALKQFDEYVLHLEGKIKELD